MQFAIVAEQASALFHRSKDKPKDNAAGSGRAEELARLRASASILDRYVALLVDRWDAQEREEQAAKARHR